MNIEKILRILIWLASQWRVVLGVISTLIAVALSPRFDHSVSVFKFMFLVQWFIVFMTIQDFFFLRSLHPQLFFLIVYILVGVMSYQRMMMAIGA